jgi:putative nucleotidyltransferase with HDIG domain
MPKRLLFVDDEPMLLDGLRRALHCMRKEWDMQFVSSPLAALDALDREPFDAIVTDMRMPQMDGAQLLERVKERHGGVVRVVLSGQSEKETILRSIVPAHQFLSKPCDIHELRTRMSQAFAMRDHLQNQALASIISRMRSIPSLPALYNELTAALESENTSIGQIGEIISKDVGMAAKILQLANSAFVAARGHVSSLREAVSLIGAEMVRSLALSIQVFSQFDRNSSTAAYLPPLWNHSVAVATLAQKIAEAETGNKAAGEESFTTGLLHDLGKIVLMAEMPQEYRRVLEHMDLHTGTIRAVELEYAGCGHEEVGACLMSTWGLPKSVVEAVQFHHRPAESGQTSFTVLAAVHCADALASEGDPSPLNHDVEFDKEYLRNLGLLEKIDAWAELRLCSNSREIAGVSQPAVVPHH